MPATGMRAASMISSSVGSSQRVFSMLVSQTSTSRCSLLSLSEMDHGSGQLLAVLGAGVHPPVLAFAVRERTSRHYGLPAVLGVAHPVVNEAEAPARLDVEGFGVVGHGVEDMGNFGAEALERSRW
jgi:hypothetical protein